MLFEIFHRMAFTASVDLMVMSHIPETNGLPPPRVEYIGRRAVEPFKLFNPSQQF